MDDADRCARGGVAGGLTGGLALSLLTAFRSIDAHRDVWTQLKIPALPFFGARAMDAGFAFWPVAVGVATHLAFALSWGLLFAIFAYGLSRPATVLVAPLFGIVAWLTMFYVVLPLFGLGSLARLMPPRLVATEHIVFGLAVAVGFLPFQSREPADLAALR